LVFHSSTMHIGLHVEDPLLLSDFSETLNFSTIFLKIIKYQISLKSVQWQPTCSMQMDSTTDGQTDTRDAASSRFSQIPRCVQ